MTDRPPERQTDETPGEFLARALKFATTNPHRLAQDLEGAVSATTIRSYIADRRDPPAYNLRNLRRIAEALGRYGPAVLRAYGEEEAALDLEANPPLGVTLTTDETHSLSYRGRALAPDEEETALLLIDLIRLRRDILTRR